MMLLLGNKAYQIAGQEANPKHRREWLQKAIKRLMKIFNNLDTTTDHKKALLRTLESISKEVQSIEEPSRDLVYSLFSLSFCLIGFGGGRHTPVYYQDPDQYYTAHILRGNDGQRYQDKQDAISVRQSVVKELNKKGFDDFKIALVLNTTEYHVKQLRSADKTRPNERKNGIKVPFSMKKEEHL